MWPKKGLGYLRTIVWEIYYCLKITDARVCTILFCVCVCVDRIVAINQSTLLVLPLREGVRNDKASTDESFNLVHILTTQFYRDIVII